MVWMTPIHLVFSLLAVSFMLGALGLGLLFLVQERQIKTKRVNAVFWSLPSVFTAEQNTFRWMQWGFVWLTLTMATGALLAGWLGRLPDLLHVWHVIFAVVAWGIYFVVLKNRRWSLGAGYRLICLSILGFAVVVLVFLGGASS